MRYEDISKEVVGKTIESMEVGEMWSEVRFTDGTTLSFYSRGSGEVHIEVDIT